MGDVQLGRLQGKWFSEYRTQTPVLRRKQITCPLVGTYRFHTNGVQSRSGAWTDESGKPGRLEAYGVF